MEFEKRLVDNFFPAFSRDSQKRFLAFFGNLLSLIPSIPGLLELLLATTRVVVAIPMVLLNLKGSRRAAISMIEELCGSLFSFSYHRVYQEGLRRHDLAVPYKVAFHKATWL